MQKAYRQVTEHRLRKALLAAGLATVSLPAWPQMAASQVLRAPTDKGVVTGVVQGETAAFLGIPYAAPPVGELRFRPPEPHAPWATPLAATTPASPCPQVLNSVSTNEASANEDCLYLNVWTKLGHGRNRKGGSRPVMLWIYGGGFQFGSGSSPYYNGALLAEKGDVVVVTFNYRLGALGFLTTPALDAESPAHVSGNYGIEDQQAALRWVRRNIASFGGDPRNVTIFGQSAGARSVEYQLASPYAAGLFDRAIIESSGGGAATLAASEAGSSAGIIKAVGCDAAGDVAACLRAVPATDFLSPTPLSPGNAAPVVDGVVIPRQPLDALNSGRFNRVPTIVGSTHDEWTALTWPVEAPPNPPVLTEAAYAAQVSATYRGNALAVLAQYPANSYPTPTQALATAETDSNIACPTLLARQALARYVPTFGYEFSEADPARGSLLGPPVLGLDYGAYHTSDVPYVFGVSTPDGAALTGKDVPLSDRIMAYWTNLAKSGGPNLPSLGDAGPYWPDYRFGQSLISLQDDVAQISEASFEQDHRCSFWNTLPPSN